MGRVGFDSACAGMHVLAERLDLSCLCGVECDRCSVLPGDRLWLEDVLLGRNPVLIMWQCIVELSFRSLRLEEAC